MGNFIEQTFDEFLLICQEKLGHIHPSSKEAKEHGLAYYWTGKECSKGHISYRLMSNRTCCACSLGRAKRRHQKGSKKVLRSTQWVAIDEIPDIVTEALLKEDKEYNTRTVFGWGINDATYNVYKTAKRVINGKEESYNAEVCPYYLDWIGILYRSLYSPHKEENPTYKDCSVSEEWKYFSNFINWVDSQPNKNWRNLEVDKDLLVVGNKHYSPDTVIYVHSTVNKFIRSVELSKDTNDLMIGVSKASSRKGTFRASCWNPFTKVTDNLGVFKTELEAHKVWQACKHSHACNIADLQDDERVAKALRVRYTPDKDWTKVIM